MKSAILALILTLVGCSSYQKDRKEVQDKVSESKVSGPEALGGTIQDLIQNSTTLSEAQKKQLENILALNKQKAEELSQESYRFRGVMIEELLSGNPSQKKIKILKRDIKRVEDARLKNTFDTVEKISQIVSKDPDQKKFADHMIMMEPRGKK